MYVRAVGGRGGRSARVAIMFWPPSFKHSRSSGIRTQRSRASLTRSTRARVRVRRIFLDEGGEAFALTLVALTIDVEAATRIFLCHGQYVAMDAGKLRSLRALMSSTPMRAAARIVAAINGVARPDRDPPRRSSWREDSNVHAGAWRRLGGGRLWFRGVSQPLRQNQSA